MPPSGRPNLDAPKPGLASDGFPTATVRVGGSAIPEVLASLGLDPAEVLAELGVERTVFENPDNVVSLLTLGRMLQYCTARARCPHFGLLVGQRANLQSLGLVGLAARYAPNVEAALQTIAAHFHLHNTGAQIAVSTDDRHAYLSIDAHQSNIPAVNQFCDGALAGLCNVLRSLCGPEWRPTEIFLAHARPADVRPYRRIFRAPLRFDADRNVVVFPVAWITRALPASDPALTRLLQRQLATLDARYAHSFPQQVRATLRSVLLSGNASAEHVAGLFSMHSRTLRRRLAASGVTFKALADEGRKTLALELLANTALDVSQIASALDYADSSAFTRAFRRWTGTTPAAWRSSQTPLGGRAPHARATC
jgi:AraC-like DNA-binding protein